MLQQIEDLIGGEPLGIEHQLDAHLLEQQLVLGREKVVVVNSGCNFLGSEIFGEQRAHDVHILWHERHDGDEQISVLHVGLAHHPQRGWRSFDGDHVGYRADVGKPLRIIVNDGYVIGLKTKHLRQMRTYLAGSLNDDFHINFLKYSKIPFPLSIASGTIHSGKSAGTSILRCVSAYS